MAYASADNLKLTGMPAVALAKVDAAALPEALEQASELIDSYIRGRYTLPLSNWGGDLRRACIVVAVYDLLSLRGYTPAGEDDNVRLRYLDVLKWLEGVRDEKIHTAQIVDATPDESEESATVVCDALRGW